jgi:uncharacterized damage-inducible protein DinB
MHIQLDMINTLFDYNQWANEKLLQTLAGVGEKALYENMQNGIGSMHSTLVHMLSGMWIWRTRWQGGMPDMMLRTEDFPTFEAILQRWREEEMQLHAFLTTLSADDMTRDISYISTMVPGKLFTLPLWKTMMHQANHMNQHRSEIAMRLTALQHSPGELGMNVFFNE